MATSILLQNYFSLIYLYFPLGIIGAMRWIIWLTKKIVAIYYKQTNEISNNLTLSVVATVYNENPEIFSKALFSWQQNLPNEIIAVIDYTDKANIQVFNEFSKSYDNCSLIITHIPGKRPSLALGIKSAHSEVIALVDSDAIWDKNIKSKILSPFTNNSIGGDATRQEVYNPKTIAQRLFNIHLSNRYFNEFPFLAVTGNALTCLSGRTAIYRKLALENIVEDMLNEKFLGQQCISGEDKSLTRLIQKQGWKTKYLMDISIKTPGAPDIKTFFKQQIRWARNSWREDLKSLFSYWIWSREKILAIYIIDRFIQPFILFFGPISLFLAIYLKHWIIVFIIIMWWLISRTIKIFPHLKRHPQDYVILPIYILNTYIIAFIRIYALFTIKTQGWITRWDKNRFSKPKKFISTISIASTLLVVMAIGTLTAEYNKKIFIFNQPTKQLTINNLIDKKTAKPKSEIIQENKKTENQKNILPEINNNARYRIRSGDTLISISRKYNVNLKKILQANESNILNPNIIKIEEEIIIPINELTKTPIKLISYKLPTVSYDNFSDTIILRGEGSAITIPTLYNLLRSEDKITYLGQKEWLLKSNILVTDLATLIIDENISWLKMKSDKYGFVSIKSENGNIGIFNTKITSWDELTQNPDINYTDGRSFILSINSGRMDVINSEIAFLGHNTSTEDVGGDYGLSWKIYDIRFNKDIVTGTIANNKIHNNYYGVYIYGATANTIQENEFYDNTVYGIVVSGYSNNVIIDSNHIYSNGDQGIFMGDKSFYNNIYENNIY